MPGKPFTPAEKARFEKSKGDKEPKGAKEGSKKEKAVDKKQMFSFYKKSK